MKPPMCEECDEEMNYFSCVLTMTSGWSCDSCGWSIDEEEPVQKEETNA